MEELALKGYGADSTLADGVLTIVASNAFVNSALGARRRSIPVEDIDALEFRPADMLRNGMVTIGSSAGKTILHFRRAQTESARVLYEALLAQSGAHRDAKVSAPFASEGLALRAERATQRRIAAQARAEAARADAQAERARMRAELEASRARFSAEVRAAWGGRIAATGRDASRGQSLAAELEALLDAAELPEGLATARPEASLRDGAGFSEAAAVDPEAPSTSPLDRARELLDRAEAASEVRHMQDEEALIRAARRIAREEGSRRDRRVLDGDLDGRLERGALRRGAVPLGMIRCEGGFARWLRTQSIPTQPTGERRIEIWSDRVVTADAAYAITTRTSAQVYVDGQETILRRPSLARAAFLAPLPGSALLPALAMPKEEIRDRRVAEVQIGDVNWALRTMVHPDHVSEPRQLAERINSIAESLRPAGRTAEPSGSDLIGQLERLAFLVDRGTVGEEEAAAIKAAILRRLTSDGDAPV